MTLVSIQQTLHGYDGGHRLLAASTSLPAEGTHLMLVMSDLAGARQGRGFDEYLTGYPLKGSDYYALGRTWLAPEMPRPGCVWTHTLLIPSRSLADLDGPRLSRAHRRPKGALDTTPYQQPLALSGKPRLQASVDPREARAFIEALYEFPRYSVWISGTDSASYEGLVLALWTQQWP